MDNVNGLRMDGVRESMLNSTKKEKIRVQVIFTLGIFSFVQRIVMSRISVGFMFRFRV